MLNRRFWLFLYSNANILGCIWGILGLIAFFATKQMVWLYAVPILYSCGYWLTPKTTALPYQRVEELSARDLQTMLETLIKKIRKQVTHSVLAKVEHIKENVFLVLPHLEEMKSADYDLHIIKQTITDYLPEMLSTYLELPPAFAKIHPIKNGKTAQDILIEQLSLLDEQIEQILISVTRKDAESLLAQGEFLKTKFANDKDWLA